VVRCRLLSKIRALRLGLVLTSSFGCVSVAFIVDGPVVIEANVMRKRRRKPRRIKGRILPRLVCKGQDVAIVFGAARSWPCSLSTATIVSSSALIASFRFAALEVFFVTSVAGDLDSLLF